MRSSTLVALVAAVVAGGIARVSSGGDPSPTANYTDPFAYCASVRTVDAPDARYTGPPVPPAIARGLARAFDAPADAPLEPFVRGTSWRCMDGEVWACTVGANLPCQEKANASREPDAATSAYCRENRDAELVPAYVTGRATIFAWRCSGGRPAIVRQVDHADARGFLAGVWYEIPRP